MATGFAENGVDLDVTYLRRSDINIDATGLFSWGVNVYGQLGLGDRINRSSPTQITNNYAWKQIFGGGGPAFFAIDAVQGKLWSWGANADGILGGNNLSHRSSPTLVGGTDWASVSLAGNSVAALKTNGTLWTWGGNETGQLGTGNLTPRSSPVQLGALTNWAQVDINGAFADSTACAVKTNGTLWTWGSNLYGQLGSGTIISRSSPVQVGALTNWKKVVNGGIYCVALKTNGTLWSWGDNTWGYLGNGTDVPRSSPVQVGALTDWSDVWTCDGSVFATKTNGTLWAWGSCFSGQLGLGFSSSGVYSPTQVGAAQNWRKIATSSKNTYAIKTDGTLWVCGDNNVGSLGNGTTVASNVFIQVGSLNTWEYIATCRAGAGAGAAEYNAAALGLSA